MSNKKSLENIFFDIVLEKSAIENLKKFKKNKLKIENFKLLTLACWCGNFDIIIYLSKIDNYFEDANKNNEFLLSLKNLERFNRKYYEFYNELWNDKLLKSELIKSIKKSEKNAELIKF